MNKRIEKRGDTMIEVMFAVAIFGLISIMTIGVMSNALARAEGNLQQTMAREEMEAQAEAIRFIYQAAQNEQAAGLDKTFSTLWKEIAGKAEPYDSTVFRNATSCESMQKDLTGGFAISSGSSLNLTGVNSISSYAYPQVTSSGSYGLWVIATKTSEYYDFYIHTCFYATGSTTITKLDSTVRLLDPGI